jgi:uncharacterized Zn-finger protein
MKILKYLLILLTFSYTCVYSNNFVRNIFSGDYASAYDSSDLMINGPQTNLDLTLLQVRTENNSASYLHASGDAEFLLTHPIDSNDNQ